MTLIDLCMLLKKNLLVIVVVPVVCALVCLGVMWALPPVYAATATLVATGNAFVLDGTATSIANREAAATGLDIKAVTSSATITITVCGGDAQECVDVANSTAEQVRERTLQNLAQTSEADELAQKINAVASEALADGVGPTGESAAFYALALSTADDTTISITEAIAATDVSTIKLQYVVIAALAGLFLALALILIRDTARGSVHNASEVEENYDVRLLGSVRASTKRRSGAAAEDAALLAALDFAGKGENAQAVCLVPMENAESAKRIVTALEGVAETAGKHLACVSEHANLTLSDSAALTSAIASQTPADADLVFVMAPAVAESADFAYLAPACGCAVLVVEAMRTERTHFETALRQLALSDTDVAGFIMVSAA